MGRPGTAAPAAPAAAPAATVLGGTFGFGVIGCFDNGCRLSLVGAAREEDLCAWCDEVGVAAAPVRGFLPEGVTAGLRCLLAPECVTAVLVPGVRVRSKRRQQERACVRVRSRREAGAGAGSGRGRAYKKKKYASILARVGSGGGGVYVLMSGMAIVV